ncbi:hypothetical protein BOTBODRAFT_45767 [Botryobasidium botryosum FD-172 SS1]|uniref:TEL2-interacting protein 1 n=1 Tax=Botryobasidium botryosum (strain FD-172 SS1) TaxID=930990 RepID=A0A067MM48_BOTB1|nr:hypothetical protein BOTBODRAFT_45767 [Botryobasidium botryosum FD-172 SS1]
MGADSGSEASARFAFQQLKPICVPILSQASLTPSTTQKTLLLLEALLVTLRGLPNNSATFTPNLIKYVFFPISSILQRNPTPTIPDQIFEKCLLVLDFLCNEWWWTCELKEWGQFVMLASAVICGIDGRKRDDETKEAAARYLWTLMRDHSDDPADAPDTRGSKARFPDLQEYANSQKFIPVLGQTLNGLLGCAESPHLALQLVSLQCTKLLLSSYLPSHAIPSVLPGVVSTMGKVALGHGGTRGWQKGDVVDRALGVMAVAIVNGIGDEICIEEGAIKPAATRLEDLADIAQDLEGDASTPNVERTPASPWATPRTPAWLRGTASQLHIALNALSSLLSHPTPSALIALSRLSSTVLSSTTLTLPTTHTLLLSNLLTLSVHDLAIVADPSKESLKSILTSPIPSHLHTLLQMTHQNLSTLPIMIPSHSDAKVGHMAMQVVAVCQLAEYKALGAISAGVAQFLGSIGGIEKWGYRLLQVLEFTMPAIAPYASNAAAFLTEGDVYTPGFPPLEMKHVASRETRNALEKMLRALGAAGGEGSLFAIDWFVGVAAWGRGTTQVAALWCAGRILEGAGGVELEREPETDIRPVGKRFQQVIRSMVKVVADFWNSEDWEGDEDKRDDETAAADDFNLVEYRKGVVPLKTLINFDPSSDAPPPTSVLPSRETQSTLHVVHSLQLLTIASGIITTGFSPLLLHTIYPLLRSLVSPIPIVASTAQAALYHITRNCSYASPANLLLSNFDYALDAASRRLTRARLDVQATKVLVELVRLIGRDVVVRAGDVIEVCFDRLDEYHGYGVLVEGLVQVLGQVVAVVEIEEQMKEGEDGDGEVKAEQLKIKTAEELGRGEDRLDAFVEWYKHRNDIPGKEKAEDLGPTPQQARGLSKDDQANEERPTQPIDQKDDTPQPSPTQTLVERIVSRSIYFLTHPSPLIRARILALLRSSTAVLRSSPSSILPSVHKAWPFIVNRFSDPEPFVVTEAAALVEGLVTHAGDFMAHRVWDDVWPRFQKMLVALDQADAKSALAKRGRGGVGTESAYSVSHRTYRSLLAVLAGVASGVRLKDELMWDVAVACRRFLSAGAHAELRAHAREVYVRLGRGNPDMVWLVLCATLGKDPREPEQGVAEGETEAAGNGIRWPSHLRNENWDCAVDVGIVLGAIG